MTIVELQELMDSQETVSRLKDENMALRMVIRQLMNGDPETEAQDREVFGMVAQRRPQPVIIDAMMTEVHTFPVRAQLEEPEVTEAEAIEEFEDYEEEEAEPRRGWVWLVLLVVEFVLNSIYRAGWVGVDTAVVLAVIALCWAGMYAVY